MKLLNINGETLFEAESSNTIKELLEVAISARANLEGAYLEGAYLEGADLEGADLKRANLYRANLYRANLEGATLRGADLREANLGGANLGGANLGGARGIFSFYLGRHQAFATKTMLGIGCKWLSWKEWLEKYAQIGADNGYTPQEIEDYAKAIQLFHDIATRE